MHRAEANRAAHLLLDLVHNGRSIGLSRPNGYGQQHYLFKLAQVRSLHTEN
jgi:hypothetical protein